jgi:hypothetical protein
MRPEKYQIKRTEGEGGRQKITDIRYRILDNEGKVIDAHGTAANPPRRPESPTGMRPAKRNSPPANFFSHRRP